MSGVLKEEIREVFQIFDEDESGSISLQELTRALYTITGERIARSELLKLVANAREAVAQEQQQQQIRNRLNTPPNVSDKSPTGALEGAAAGGTAGGWRGGEGDGQTIGGSDAAVTAAGSVDASHRAGAIGSAEMPSLAAQRSSSLRSIRAHDNSDGIDANVFEQVVLCKLHSRSYEEELNFAFALLEDKYYPGFVTKESLKKAAADAEEPLTEAEVMEMFDSLVTGVPTAAIDFATFANIQSAARQLEDSCQRTVCDDCAPRTTRNGGVGGSDGAIRLCRDCAQRQAQQPSTHATHAVAPLRKAATEGNAARPTTQPGGGGVKLGGSNPAPAGSPSSGGENPVLAAALRRQQQNAVRGQTPVHFSHEKLQLLREIDSILAGHGETAPFGLRSADEQKLRSYLRYLNERYER